MTIGENRAGAAKSVSSNSSDTLPLPAERDPQGPRNDSDDDEAFVDCQERFEEFGEFRDAGALNPCGDFEPEGFTSDDSSDPMGGFDSAEFSDPPLEDQWDSYDAGVWEEKDL